jgi:hypothetical protein
MEILKFDSPGPSRPRKKNSSSRAVLGIMTVAALGALGSTFAANISLNSGAAVEFGQGVAVTAACDPEITVTPGATFTNTTATPTPAATPTNLGTFKVGTVTITGIDVACVNKVFKLQFWDITSTTAKTITTTGATHLMAKFQYKTACVPYTEGGAETTISTTASTPITAITCTQNAAAGTAALTLGNGTLSATDVYKVTLESGAA